eukprot:gene19169-22811_t
MVLAGAQSEFRANNPNLRPVNELGQAEQLNNRRVDNEQF